MNTVTRELKDDVEKSIKENTNAVATGNIIQADNLDALAELLKETKTGNAQRNLTSYVPKTAQSSQIKEIIEEKKEKGVILSSSIALRMNKDRLEAATNSEIEMIPTYHVKEPDSA